VVDPALVDAPELPIEVPPLVEAAPELEEVLLDEPVPVGAAPVEPAWLGGPG
jgi:hypothetical protein